MKKTHPSILYLISFILFISTGLFSCSSTKHIKYFEDIPDSGQLKKIVTTVYVEPKIQVNDALTIVVSTTDPLATQNINTGNVAVIGLMPGSTAAQSPASGTAGYLVNADGYVELPILGKLHVVGLTLEEATSVIKTKADEFYKDPSVIVRFANFKVTVMGEVTKPSIYIMPSEKVTILDALSLAGDLTIYGKRDNILLVRESADGTKIPYRVNLNRSNIMNEPYYYLRQNDFIYVEPTKGKAAANDIAQTRNITIISSILTIIVVFVCRINF